MIDLTTCGLHAGGFDNTAALNALLANGSEPLHLVFPPGVFQFHGNVQCVNRSLRIDAAGVEGTILQWSAGGLRFSGDFSHRFSFSNASIISQTEASQSAAITITSTDTVPNTIGNQHKLSDLAIRPSAFAAGGYFMTGIRIDGGEFGIGNVSLRDIVIQGNSAVGVHEEGCRGPVMHTRGLQMTGRTYGIRLETCQLTWLDVAADALDRPESFQWIGSSAGACRVGVLCASNTWESGVVGTFTVERGDFACYLRGVYLVNNWQARIHGNTFLNFNYPSSSFTGIDFQGNCSQAQILNNRVYPVYSQTAPSNRYGIYYPGSHSTIADTQTVACQIGVYLPPGSDQNIVRHGCNQGGVGVLDLGSANLLCENRG